MLLYVKTSMTVFMKASIRGRNDVSTLSPISVLRGNRSRCPQSCAALHRGDRDFLRTRLRVGASTAPTTMPSKSIADKRSSVCRGEADAPDTGVDASVPTSSIVDTEAAILCVCCCRSRVLRVRQVFGAPHSCGGTVDHE